MADSANTGNSDAHARFLGSGRTHVLQITNHGVHEWKVVPGLPDTGGQNVYVNQFTEALIDLGYRVTIANRGGYAHPTTGKPQKGIVYHPSGHARIMYLEDGHGEFVRKEDMNEQLPALADDFARRLREDGDSYDLIISHYWDAGKLGVLLNERMGLSAAHVWIPHSLGALKKRNMDPSTWANLRIDERISHEKELLKSLSGAVATSSAIRDTFKNDYNYDAKYFLPPCVDEHRNHPRSAEENAPLWPFLAEQCGLTVEQLRQRKFVTEISRTDKTKRKDVLIKAFAEVKKAVPEAFLLCTIDPHAGALHDELLALSKQLGVQDDMIALGSIWDVLPLLYNVTDVYCTPSVMEGFGMSAQEAAATGKPVVSSDLVPYVCEYLVGEKPERVSLDDGGTAKELIYGEGAIVVPADFVAGFARAITDLLQDETRRSRMGARALDITIPYFTWRHMTTSLLDDLGVSTGEPKHA